MFTLDREFPGDKWLSPSFIPMNEQEKMFYLVFTGRFTTQTILEPLPFLEGKIPYWNRSLFQYDFIIFNICDKKRRALQTGTQQGFIYDINIFPISVEIPFLR